ncbi:hypothetical protein N7G274_002792 [Stereocaulon virgatum]|uniref:BTB domain-containing protein n=1 Tax=Stereocaulon virgatum TaxID=373712 RepID=A0ABR4AK26_9LECA
MTAPTSSKVRFKGVNSEEGLKLLEGCDAVKVIVGTETQKTWSLPKKLLAHVSPFFDAALNGSWVEATSNDISLPEDNPAAFETFVQWIYSGKLVTGSMDDIPRYIRAWTLGDKLRCPAFQDCAMLHLLHLHMRVYVEPKTVQLAYEGSMAGSRLRKWALQEFSSGITCGKYVDTAEEWACVAKNTVDFGYDYVQASAASFAALGFNPFEAGQQYLEVLVYEDEGIEKWEMAPKVNDK